MERCQERNFAIRLTNSTRRSAEGTLKTWTGLAGLSLLCLFSVSSLCLFSQSHLSVSSLLSELSRSLQMCSRIQRYLRQRITLAQSEGGQHNHAQTNPHSPSPSSSSLKPGNFSTLFIFTNYLYHFKIMSADKVEEICHSAPEQGS
jgi:hypothetical protein